MPEETVQNMTTELLKKIYRTSMTRYNAGVEKLEKQGSTDHIQANLDFRQSVKLQFPDAEMDNKIAKYERSITIITESVEEGTPKMRRGLTNNSWLLEQDEEIEMKFTKEEIE